MSEQSSSDQRTLMSEPLTLLNEDRLGGEGHEVTLDNQSGVLLAEEEWWVTVLLIAVVTALLTFEGHG